MKAKRNLFVSLVILTLLLCCSMLFVACNDEGGTGGSNPTYTVAFKVDGRNYDIVLVEEGKTVTFPVDPEKDGYTFDGWYADETCTQKYTASAVSQSIDVYAKFTANVYTITYEADGGTHANATDFTVEDKIVLTDAEKNGYAFEGWYLNGERVSFVSKGTKENVTLTAKYIANGYSVTYQNTYNAANANSKAYSAGGEDIALAPLPDLKAFTFLGWYEEGGDMPVTTILAGTGKNVTLVAKWEEKTAHKSFLYNVSEDGDIIITGIKDKTVTELIVPDYVYSIDLGAFKDCTGLKKLIVPYVGNRSNGEYGSLGYFFGAKSYLNNANVMPQSLTEVTVTGGYGNDETIKTGAFYNCFHLENVVIEDGVTYMGRSVFYDNIALENITLPFVGDTEKYNQSDSYVYPFSWVFGANTAISDMMMFKDSYAYEWKTYWNNENGISCIGYIPNSLKTITINNGIIGIRCFDSYTFIENIILGNGVTHIGERAFADSYNLKIITIPDSVIHIDGTAFSQTPFGNNLKEDDTGCIYINNVLFKYVGSASEVTIKDGTISISNSAFGYNNSLTSVKCPSSLKYIGDEYGRGSGVFEGCNNLTNIELNDGLECIGAWAFYECINLSSIDFPESIEYIGNDAFLNTKWFNELPDGEIYIGKVFFKYNGEMPENTKITIKDGTISIAASAFSKSNFDDTSSLDGDGYDNLVEVNIPNSVTHIGDAAFRFAHNLKNVTLPKSLTVLGGEAFHGCTSLEKIVIPSGVTALYQMTFSGNVIIEFEDNSKLKTVGPNTFSTLSPNGMVYLPNSIECVYASGFNTEATLIFPKGTKNFVTRTYGNLYGTGMKFYDGTEEEARNIINFPADIYYYSETEPVPNETGHVGDYWHYDEDGNPVEWKEETIDSAYTLIDATVGKNSDENADKLFDRDITTKWCVEFDSNNYVIFRSEEAITIHGYTFTTANDNAKHTGRNPKSWTIYGSNDEDCADASYESWAEICSVTDDATMQNVNYTAYTFSIDGNTTAYQYYKIVFTAKGSDDNILQLSEISLSYT